MIDQSSGKRGTFESLEHNIPGHDKLYQNEAVVHTDYMRVNSQWNLSAGNESRMYWLSFGRHTSTLAPNDENRGWTSSTL